MDIIIFVVKLIISVYYEVLTLGGKLYILASAAAMLLAATFGGWVPFFITWLVVSIVGGLLFANKRTFSPEKMEKTLEIFNRLAAVHLHKGKSPTPGEKN